MQVTIGLIQKRAVEEPAANLLKGVESVRKAASQGAQIICLQELFMTPYFCQKESLENFDLAESIPGPTCEVFSKLAAELEVVIIVSLFEKRGSGVYHNTAVVVDADGAVLGKYRKMHIPDDPGFSEKYYFTPGDLGYRAWDTRFGKIGVLICWDQWFPEAARLTALAGAQILFYPTAIGWSSEEKGTELGDAQRNAWEAVQKGHGVANGCYIAAVNRVGTEGDLYFWGSSFVSDPYGRFLSQASENEEALLLQVCDLDALEAFRRTWPFFRDRRIDSYENIQQRLID
ncbi:MAG: carbon-nitrogen hydrolase [Verrucomicrobia bacterium]|nr:carbon-nitrogen hydrolase [Verrucomicrobiota bacterium]MDA1065166.1 carbon-nitrogen hydrolase [Verrucomicrobiota bacterium]